MVSLRPIIKVRNRIREMVNDKLNLESHEHIGTREVSQYEQNSDEDIMGSNIELPVNK